MEDLLWSLRSTSGQLSWGPIVLALMALVLLRAWEFPVLLGRRLFFWAARRPDLPDELPRPAPAVMVVIPTLLRKPDELASLKSTLRSIASNGYPGSITAVVSIDGANERPDLYADLDGWADDQSWPGRFELFVTQSPTRRGKPMAIERAIGFVRELVEEGHLPAVPPIYVSTDADADLGFRAIEYLVARLHRRHWLTGSPPRAVAGALHVRGENEWKGWRHFFTIANQLNLQVAREYYVGNLARTNVRVQPITGLPGALYCTWSSIFLSIPKFLGYSRTLERRHWWNWWRGIAPPMFSTSRAPELPELMAGDTDDTVTAYISTLTRYRDGRFIFDPPRTPIHALWDAIVALLIDRPLRYEPRAKVFTTSPMTFKSLFKQRKRWNSCRVELAGRLWPIFGYYWQIGLPMLSIKLAMAQSLVFGVVTYFVAPLFLWKAPFGLNLLFGYALVAGVWGLMVVLAMVINDDLKAWRLLLGIPLSPIYQFFMRWLPFAAGVTADVFLFGNRTGFAPETTMIKGNSVRVALMFRTKRAFSLAVRSVVKGDVPFGSFWFGWRETPWTPSGFEGFSSRPAGTLWRRPAVRAPPARERLTPASPPARPRA